MCVLYLNYHRKKVHFESILSYVKKSVPPSKFGVAVSVPPYQKCPHPVAFLCMVMLPTAQRRPCASLHLLTLWRFTMYRHSGESTSIRSNTRCRNTFELHKRTIERLFTLHKNFQFKIVESSSSDLFAIYDIQAFRELAALD